MACCYALPLGGGERIEHGVVRVDGGKAILGQLVVNQFNNLLHTAVVVAPVTDNLAAVKEIKRRHIHTPSKELSYKVYRQLSDTIKLWPMLVGVELRNFTLGSDPNQRNYPDTNIGGRVSFMVSI